MRQDALPAPARTTYFYLGQRTSYDWSEKCVMDCGLLLCPTCLSVSLEPKGSV